MMLENISWSSWLLLHKSIVNQSVPREPGVYQIRPVGAISAAYIGSGIGRYGLQQRIGQRVSNPSRYLSGFEKQLDQIGIKLEFCFAIANDAETALEWEAQLLKYYRSKHDGKLPPGNKILPKID